MKFNGSTDTDGLEAGVARLWSATTNLELPVTAQPDMAVDANALSAGIRLPTVRWSLLR